MNTLVSTKKKTLIEKSWLAFNARVLQEADDSVPLDRPVS
jgi:polyphosphate kinase